MKYLVQMFSGKDGTKVSNLRVNVTLWTAGVLFCMLWLVIKNPEGLKNLPESVILSVPAAFLAKGWQRSKEGQSPKNP